MGYIVKAFLQRERRSMMKLFMDGVVLVSKVCQQDSFGSRYRVGVCWSVVPFWRGEDLHTKVGHYFNKAKITITMTNTDDSQTILGMNAARVQLRGDRWGPGQGCGRIGSVEELEEIAMRREMFARYFFQRVLVEAIIALQETTRTRRHNLTLQSAHCKIFNLSEYTPTAEPGPDATGRDH